jgi:uncharacterized protein
MDKLAKITKQLLLEDPIFQNMLNHLKTKFNCHTIILYGSRARGLGVTDSSDYDLIAIRRTGENLREACEFEGRFLDAWIYSESILKKIDSSFLRIRNGLVIEQKKDLATKLLKKIDEIFNAGPIPTPEWESALISSWLQKMFQRSALKDIEGNYRRHWLLFDCLESYFKLRNLWYHGPKESFNWLETYDRKVYLAFEKALSTNAKEVDIKNLIELVLL